jgi:SAM-dependent methyltransferase
MNSATAARLIEINREFYTRFGDSFSATRHRLQPGVRRVLDMFDGDESILDLGCGNGEFARELAKRHHCGPYLGVDFSLPLLRDAGLPPAGTSQPEAFSAKFLEADLTRLSEDRNVMESGTWDVVTAFAVLHHIPSDEIRLDILRAVRKLLSDDGTFILSSWQFLNSEKLKARIQPWDAVAVSASDVDAGDYLLDWRSGGEGLRYIHQYSQAELSMLAGAAGFLILDQYYSDGEGGNLGLYQIWKKKS